MNSSKVLDPTVKTFLKNFLRNRTINTEFYKRVPEDKMDYHMVDKLELKSDSPRRSLVHQIYVTRKYIYGVRTGVLKFDGITYRNLTGTEKISKEDLIRELDETKKELIDLLSDPQIVKRKVKVPWSKVPVSAIQCLHGLYDHEILHTGWNLALMDHLGIERFPELQAVWG